MSKINTTQRRPDLICIGATKAGTSWLFQNLSANPTVWRSPIKEVNAIPKGFAPEKLAWTKTYLQRQLEMLDKRGGAGKLGWDEAVYAAYVDGLRQHNRQDATWYDAFYGAAPKDKALVDVSPSYAPMPREAVSFLAEACPEAKFVYIVRDPVARAMSHVRMLAARPARNVNTAEKWAALAREEDVRMDSAYAANVKRWRDALGDRLLCLPFGGIRSDPLGFVNRIEDYAGIARTKTLGQDSPFHATQKIDVPPEVKAHFEAAFAEDRAFIAREFGADFASQTK